MKHPCKARRDRPGEKQSLQSNREAKLELKKREFLAASLGLGVGLTVTAAAAQPDSGEAATAYGEASKSGSRQNSFAGSGRQTSMVDPHYKPRRINKAIELWEDKQPVFTITFVPSGIGDGYEMGKAMAKTWADAINYECEQGAFDIPNLRNFMQGLVDGGPTASGHRTPMVFVSPPVTGIDETYVRCNSWVLQQIMAAGVHSIDLCHARDPKAVEMAIAALRYPVDYPGAPKQRLEGLRGNGSEEFAAHIWGVTGNKYMYLADFWPLNPRGELAFGVKIEDKYAHANVDKTLAVPGVCYAEWGPGDTVLSVLGLAAYPENTPPRPGSDGTAATPVSHNDPVTEKLRQAVMAACLTHGVMPLNMSHNHDPIAAFKEGNRMFGASNEAATLALREYTGRKMPI